jgi:hypothetical protein
LEEAVDLSSDRLLMNERFSKNCIVYEIMSKNVVETEGATNSVTIWCIRVAC